MGMPQLYRVTTESCSAALRTSWEQFPRILLAPLLDLLFFIAMGFATAPIFERILVYAQAYFGSLAAQGPALVDASLRGSMFGFNPLLLRLLLLYGVLLITAYAIYVLLQGLIWGWCIRAAQPQFDIFPYLRRFAAANILWVPLYGIIHLLDLLYLFQSAAAERAGVAASKFLPAVGIVLAVLLAYFAFTDYILIAEKEIARRWQRLRQSIKLFPPLFPLLLFLGLLFLAGNALLNWAFAMHKFAGMALGLLLVLPLFSYFRLAWYTGVSAAKHSFK